MGSDDKRRYLVEPLGILPGPHRVVPGREIPGHPVGTWGGRRDPEFPNRRPHARQSTLAATLWAFRGDREARFVRGERAACVEPTGHNMQYLVLDLDRLAGSDIARYQQANEELERVLLDAPEKLPPLPIARLAPISELPQVLQQMGKAPISANLSSPWSTTRSPSVPRSTLDERALVGPDSSFPPAALITGGNLWSEGLHTIPFLLRKGIRHFLLVSRTGFKAPEDEAMVRRWQWQERQKNAVYLRGSPRNGIRSAWSTGSPSRYIRLDVTEYSALHQCLAERLDRVQLTTIIHAAGVLYDAPVDPHGPQNSSIPSRSNAVAP